MSILIYNLIIILLIFRCTRIEALKEAFYTQDRPLHRYAPTLASTSGGMNAYSEVAMPQSELLAITLNKLHIVHYLSVAVYAESLHWN